MKSNVKKGIFALVIVGAVSFAAIEAFSHGSDRGYGHMGPGYGMGHGYGHMGPGYGHMGTGHMGDYGSGRLGYMKEWLGLSEKQVGKIFKLGTKYREKFFENRNNRDKIYSLRKEYNKDIENVLTKKQKEIFNGKRAGERGSSSHDCGW